MLTRGREAKARASPDTVLSPLPRGFVRAVFLLLPVDTRLRCSEVSRAWRALLADTSLYTRLNLSLDSGLARFNLALLRTAAAKAGGRLRALDFTGQNLEADVRPGVREVVASNAATLIELRVYTDGWWAFEEVRALLEAAPALQFLEMSVQIDRDRQVARAMLRNEPPYQALRMRRLMMVRGLDSISELVAFCLDLRCHTSLAELYFYDVALNTAAAMGAVVDACIKLRLRKLDLRRCIVVPAALPELTRLIAAGALRELIVVNIFPFGMSMFNEAHDEYTRLFVTAVRASAMTGLELFLVGVLPEIVEEAAAFINAPQQ